MDWNTLFFSFRDRINRSEILADGARFCLLGIVMLLIKLALGPGLAYSLISFVVNIVVIPSPGLAVRDPSGCTIATSRRGGCCCSISFRRC